MKLRFPTFTLFGRSLALIVAELVVNAVLWIVAGLLFGLNSQTRGVMSLCLLAWTLGLRHALDADHISAIDNATRSLIGIGKLPVTCGLYFSLGHSTIVIAVNLAIAISTDVYDKMGSFGDVGGIIGAAVSGSFLFIIGTANSIQLYKLMHRRRENKRREVAGLPPLDKSYEVAPSIVLRLLGPVTSFVNQPWKMYPVGLLFGLGFDTASSIALLAITALSKKTSSGAGMIHQSKIIILPLLFTAGMTLIDSVDSVIMAYSYADFPEKGWAVWEKKEEPSMQHENERDVEAHLPQLGPQEEHDGSSVVTSLTSPALPNTTDTKKGSKQDEDEDDVLPPPSPDHRSDRFVRTTTPTPVVKKANTISDLSILLTIISILLAFSISIITIMGLIGEQCAKCQEAAENDPGLSGKWWRGWAKANDQSGWIGAAVVGVFVVIVAGYYGGRWIMRTERFERFVDRIRGRQAGRVEI